MYSSVNIGAVPWAAPVYISVDEDEHVLCLVTKLMTEQAGANIVVPATAEILTDHAGH